MPNFYGGSSNAAPSISQIGDSKVFNNVAHATSMPPGTFTNGDLITLVDGGSGTPVTFVVTSANDGTYLGAAKAPIGGGGGGTSYTLANNLNGTISLVPLLGVPSVIPIRSSDLGNALALGADGGLFYTPPALPIPTNVAPLPNAQAAQVGVSTEYARADHVHREALTVMGYDPVTRVLSYTDEAGLVTNVDLSALAIDLRVDGASITGNTLTLTVNDAGAATDIVVDLSTLKASNVAGSITGDGNLTSLSLVNDVAAPGPTMLYGTDGTGAKGWFSIPAVPAAGSATLPASAPGNGGIGLAYARVDHVHQPQAPSAQPGNAITLGADGLHYYAAPAIPAPATIVPVQHSIMAAIGTSAEYARADHAHPFQNVSADAGNSLTVGSDGRHYYAAPAIPVAATTAPLPNAQAAVIGASTEYARADHVHREALTVLSYNPVSHFLTYTDEANTPNAIDLSGLANSGSATGSASTSGEGSGAGATSAPISASGASSTAPSSMIASSPSSIFDEDLNILSFSFLKKDIDDLPGEF